MVINDITKFIFIHNPKTAGMSLRRALGMSGNGVYDLTNFKMHMPMAYVYQYHPEIIEKMRTYFVFMMVRNPYTRFISSYNYGFPEYYYAYHESKDLQTYKRALNEFVDRMEPEMVLNCAIEHRHFIRQVDMAYHSSICFIDDYLKFEDMPKCFDRLKWNNFDAYYRLRSYKHLNARPVAATAQELLSDNSRTKIFEIYRPDFTTFGYSVEL